MSLDHLTLIFLAIVFYASLAATIELIETARERHLASGAVVAKFSPRRETGHGMPAWTRHRTSIVAVVIVGALVGAATLVSWFLVPWVAPEDVVMLYLAAIMFAALRFGRAASVVTAGLSVVCYDFFFVPPQFTLFVASPRHLVTFAMMFAVGLTLSTLAQRLKKQGIDNALEKRSEEMKTALLSAVSHDLRTPLAAITGAATALRDDDDARDIPAGERRALLEAIADEGFHLERLVENLLDMTRVESGNLRLQREWLPVDELVGSALARVEKRHGLAQRVVHTAVDGALPLLHVDPALFELALVNLVDNAAKYTPASAHVDISASLRVDGGQHIVDIVVADDGPGVPPGVDVFERFVRGPNTNGGGGGIGLGLSIARGLVEAHGGTLTLLGSQNHKGAAFRISLPAGAQPPRVPDAPEGAALVTTTATALS